MTNGRRVARLAALSLLLAGAGTRADPEAVMRELERGAIARAQALARADLAAAEQRLGESSFEIVPALEVLAEVELRAGRHDAAEVLFERAYRLRARGGYRRNQELAAGASRLGGIAQHRGDLDLAERRYAEAVEILEAVLPAGHQDIATARANLADVYLARDRPEDAERTYREALGELAGASPPDGRQLGILHGKLARALRAMGRYEASARAYAEALEHQRGALGGAHPEVAITLNNWADLDALLGDEAAAVNRGEVALDILERSLGTEHPGVAVVLANLAAWRLRQGRHAEAIALLERATRLQERSLGPEHPQLATTLSTLVTLHYEAGDPGAAARVGERIVAIERRVYGGRHPRVAAALRAVGEAHRADGDLESARARLEDARAALSATSAEQGPEAVAVLASLAPLEAALGRPERGAALYTRAQAMVRELFGPGHPRLASLHAGLARLELERGDAEAALAAARRGTAILAARLAGPGASDTADAARGAFLVHLAAAATLLEARETDPALVDEMFRVAQLARSSAAARALASIGARFAAGDDALAGAVRRHQDLGARREALERALFEAVTGHGRPRDLDAERATRSRIRDLDDEIAASARALLERYPRFAELASPRVLGVAEVAALLGPREALVTLALGPAGGGAVVVTRQGARASRVAAGVVEIERLVSTLRESLDPLDWFDPGVPPDYPLEAAHALYRAVLAGPLAGLAPGTHVLLVPDGPLQNLPVSVLVTGPAAGASGARVLRGAAWLARRYPTTVLPSVGALATLRAEARQSAAPRSFVGFGDPVLGGGRGAGRGRRDAATLFVQDGGGARVNLRELRGLPRLPETAVELRELAAALGGEARLHLGPEATERRVRGTPLEQYRVIAFATHGLMAGDFSGLTEPALVLTPPPRATALDDGLLTASEIADLRLDADWVILSACNTAAPAGQPGAEGLSGLAKAFFYAGSRALLVSHWAVASEPTVALTTGAIERLARDPAIGRAEALRQSMLAMLDGDEPELAHPAFWAPFVIVGEGGPSGVR